MTNPFKIPLLLSVTLLTACSGNDEPKPEVKTLDRTVLVYMAADNTLGTAQFDSADIREMHQAALAGDINGGRLLLYHKGPNTAPTLSEIKEDGTFAVIRDYTGDGLTSVHADRMKKVIADARAVDSDNDFGIVLWSHADGWLNSGIDETGRAANGKLRNFGIEDNKRMKLSTLANVLKASGPIDFIYFDCCYMGAAEVVYELRDVTPTIVASATELPANGMPYDQNIKAFFATEGPNLIQAAQNTYNHYNAMTNAVSRSCTMAVYNTAGMADLATATASVYAAADKLWPADYRPQHFQTDSDPRYDLADYVKRLAEDIDPALYTTWRQSFDKVVVYEAHTPKMWADFSLERCNGMSTYIPDTADKFDRKGYDTTAWYQDVASKLRK